MKSWRLLISLSALLIAILVAYDVAAQPSAIEIKEAQFLLKQGREQLENQQFANAATLLERAYLILYRPDIGYDLMQAYAGTDKLVEARAIGEEILREQPKNGEEKSLADVQTKVREAIGVLDGMIPTLVLHIAGPPPSLVRVRIDGEEVAPAEIEKPQRVNQGRHRIVVSALGYQERVVSQDVESKEAKTYHIKVDLLRLPNAISIPPPVPATPSGKTNSSHIAGKVLTGTFTAATVGTGIGAAIAFYSTTEAGMKICTSKTCNDQFKEHYSVYVGLMTATPVLGVAALTSSIVSLWSSRPDSASESKPRVSVAVTPSPTGFFIHGHW